MKCAFDLALSLRSCRTEYEWSQTVPPLFLNEKNLKRINGYKIGTKGPTDQPVKVWFVPMDKLVNDELAMLRTGTVLFG